MRQPKTSDLIGLINKIAPPTLAESWDNCGLQVGDPGREVSGVLVSLEATAAVVEAALAAGCNLLVTHHPLIFKPLSSLTAVTSQGRLIHRAISAGLGIVSIHTSYDMADGGLNDLLAARTGLLEAAPLKPSASQGLAKLVVFVPESHCEELQKALSAWAEPLGNYRDCTFSCPGEGTFTPLAGASPFIGSIGNTERVAEQRLELLVDRRRLKQAVKALLDAHPYEEPAFDIYPLLNEGKPAGLGRIGRLPEALSLADLAQRLRCELAAPGLRYVGDPSRTVRTVALCTGSGASLVRDASRAGADVLVTGDVKFHDARDAEDLGLAVIDAGHFPTEIIMAQAVAERLREMLSGTPWAGLRVEACAVERDPFRC